MSIKYLGLKVGTVLATMAATPVVWAALAYPEWQAAATTTGSLEAVAGEVAAPLPAEPASAPRRIIIVPRLVDARTGQPLDTSAPASTAPASAPVAPPPQQPGAAAPPPQPAVQGQPAAAPARSAVTTRGS